MDTNVDRLVKYASFGDTLSSALNDESFYSIPVNERGNYVAGLIEGFSKINNLNEDDKDYIGKLAEEQLTDFRISNNIPRFVPTQEQAAELFDRFPDTSTDERVEDVERKVDAWKASSLAKASALRPAEREDIETYLNRSSNNFIREEAARLNDTGWFMDKGYRAVEELAKPFHQLLDPDGSDRFWAKSAPENPSYDQDFTSLIAGGIGQVIPQIAISIGLTAAGSPEAIPAVFTALYGAEYMQNGYREEFARSGDEGKAWDSAVSQIPAALLETVGDTLLVRGVTKTARQFGKEFASASTMEAKKAILREALPTMGEAAKKGFIAEAFVGGMAAEWASGYGSYLATGDENYLRSTKDIIKGGLAEGIVGGLTAGLLHGVTNDSTRKAFAQDVSTLTGLKVKQEEIYAALKNGDFQKVIDITNKDIITDPAQQDATLDVVDKARAAINGKPITEEEKAATPKASSLVIPSTTRVKIRQDIENIDKELSDPSVTEERSNELNKRKQYLTDVNEKINNGTYEELNEVKGTVDTTSVYRNHEAIGKNDKGLTTQEITLDNGERFSYTTDDIPVFLQSNTFKQTLNGIVARFGQENVTVDLVATSGNAVIKWTEDGKKKHSQGFPYTRTPRKGFTPLTLNENGTLKIHNPINEIKYAGNARNVEVISDDTANNIITVKNKKGETITLDGERANTLRASIPNYKPEEVAKEKAEDTKPKEKKASVVDNSAQEKLTFERGNVPIVANGERRFLHKETNKMGVVVKDNGTLLFKPDDNSTPIELGGAESQITLNDAGLTRELDVRTPTEVDTNDIVDILEHEQIQSEKQSKPTTTVDKKAATKRFNDFINEFKSKFNSNSAQSITQAFNLQKNLLSRLFDLGIEVSVIDSSESIANSHAYHSEGKIYFVADRVNEAYPEGAPVALFELGLIHESAHAGTYLLEKQDPELYISAKENFLQNKELNDLMVAEYPGYETLSEDNKFYEGVRAIIEGRLKGRTTGLAKGGKFAEFLNKLLNYIRNTLFTSRDKIVFQFVSNVEDVLGVTPSVKFANNNITVNGIPSNIVSDFATIVYTKPNSEGISELINSYSRENLRLLAGMMRLNQSGAKQDLIDRIVSYKPVSENPFSDNSIMESRSQTFNNNITEVDREYLAAVMRGDNVSDDLESALKTADATNRQVIVDSWMERNPKTEAELQRMADEAAKVAGFQSVAVIHSTNAEFNTFGRVRKVATARGKIDTVTTIKSSGVGLIYATQNAAYSALFGNKQIRLYHSISNPADLRSLGARNVSDSEFDGLLTSLGINHKPSAAGMAPVFERLNKGQHKKAMIEAGFDGFVLREKSGDLEADAIAGFDSSQFKSADPVTFDDAGNIIPPSKRFNPQSNNINESQPINLGDKFSFRLANTQQDTEYLAAVEAGDMATAQRMVDEARLMPRKVHNLNGIEVIRNPKDSDYKQLNAEYRKEYPFDRSGDPTTRFTTDAFGNRWIWRSDFGMHMLVEPKVEKAEGRTVGQNEFNWNQQNADPVTYDESGNVIPLSQRFDSTNNNIQNSQPINLGDKFSFRLANTQQDTEYLAAVKAGDMETAQRMVDEAAKAAGYNIGPVYHGTKGKRKGVFPFTVFEMRVGKNTRGEDNPVAAAYFTESKGVAEGAAFMQSNMGRNGKPTVGRFFLRNVKRREDVEGDVEYRVTDPNQIKSADPVTRDADGNVIPLSQRFDSTNNNIQNSQPINLGDKFSFRLANVIRNAEDTLLGLKIANDGTLPTQSLIAKVRKSGITEFEVDSITNLINSLEDNGRVNISELSESIDNEPTVVINTLDYSGGSVSRRAELEHNFDTINPSWREIVDRGNDEEMNSLPDSILNNLSEWMEVEETGRESATGRFGVDPYSNEVLSGAEIEPGHRLIWSGDLSLNQPGDKKFNSQHYQGDVAKNQVAFVRGGIHEYQKGNVLPDGTIATETTRIFEIWEVQSDWDSFNKKNLKSEIDIDSDSMVGKTVSSQYNKNSIAGRRITKEFGDNIWSKEIDKNLAIKLIETVRYNESLLKYWESLALKAVLNHAKKEGVSNIISSDAETAMMTERHDDVDSFLYNGGVDEIISSLNKFGYYAEYNKSTKNITVNDYNSNSSSSISPDENGKYTFNNKYIEAFDKDDITRITQEKGMRAAYDERIPNGLSKLSNSKGKKVTVGKHNNGPSKVFKNPDGTPKNTNTGLMFPVNNNIELQFSQPITNEENTNEGESKPNENIIDEVVDSEYEHTDTVLGTPISPFRKTQIERLNKLRSVKIEALLSVEDKALFKSIKAIKALAALNDDVLAEYVTLYEDFISTRSNNIDAGISRPASSELINKLSSLTEKAKQAWFEEQKDTFPELAQKDFQKDFQGKMDYVNDFISKLSGMEETTGTDKVSKNKEAFLAKIDDLRAVINENYDQMKEDLFSRMDLDFKESDNPHIQKGIELMRARMNDSKEWYGEFLNHLLNVDVIDMSAKNVRNTYYALMSVAYDGYVMNTDGFVSSSINDLLADSEGVVPLNTFTSTAAARVVPNLMSTSTKARSIVSNKGYIALQKIASNFRESLKQSHMMHELVLVPYQKESIDNAQKKSGKRYSDSDLQRIGIYAISRRIRIGFDVKSEIERNISQIKDSILVLSRSGDKKLRRASEWYNKYIDTLFDGVLKSETPIETLESNAVNAGIDDGMKGYVNDIVNFFDAFKPIAKFTKEFIYNREFIDEHNYVPTMILNLDESKGPLQYNTDDVTLNMTPEDTSERNVNTNGMSGTFDRSARLKENQALVFNINHLFSNRGRLNFLDAFSAVRRKEISTLLNAKTQKGQEMRDFLGDEFGGQFRYHTFIDFVKTQWKAEIESVQYIHQYQSVINGALSRWGGFALSSVYQGVMQLTSNIAPFMMANIGNPQKISAMFKAYDYMNRHRAGLLTPQQALIYEKVLFDVAHRHQDQVLDTSVNLGITQDGLWQAFKSSAIANGISKVDKIIDKVKFFQFRAADFLSGAPVMLAEYLDAEQKRLGAEMTFEDLVYDPGSYAIALDETERFIGIGNATRRGEWMTSRDAPITIVRHMLAGFAGHRVNNATNFYVEMRKIANENISTEEKLKSASYIAGIISQSVIFSAGKVAIIYFLMSATKGILDGNDSDDDKVEELYRNRANADTEKEKKLIDAEIAKRKQIRAVWKKALDRQSDSYLFTMGLSKDIISNIFVSANLFEPIVDKLLYFPIDEHEEKMFKELKAKRTEALKAKIKNAKALGDTGSLVELQRQLADTQASEFLRMTHPSFGNIIPYGGMYGGVSRNLEKVFDASLNPDTLTLNDVSNMAAAFGWNLADVSRITRIMESVDDAKLEAEKKKRRLNGN